VYGPVFNTTLPAAFTRPLASAQVIAVDVGRLCAPALVVDRIARISNAALTI
jgi:hypothetical protein